MNKVLISPSILSGDFAFLGNSVKNIYDWGADLVHIDVMDGSYVPNITIGMTTVKALKKHSMLPFDVHLMIVNPEKYIEEFVKAGADIVSIHTDATSDPMNCLKLIKQCGAKCGIAISPDMPSNVILPYLDMLDTVIIMGVYPGFGGQKYITSVNVKIVEVSEMIRNAKKDILIELDGGVTEENSESLLVCGCNVLVAGNAVFKSNSPIETIKKLRG